MAIPDANLQSLSESQQTALVTFAAVTDQEQSQALPLLQRSEWNVQVWIGESFFTF
jgi:FAS-associated factor 2